MKNLQSIVSALSRVNTAKLATEELAQSTCIKATDKHSSLSESLKGRNKRIQIDEPVPSKKQDMRTQGQAIQLHTQQHSNVFGSKLAHRKYTKLATPIGYQSPFATGSNISESTMARQNTGIEPGQNRAQFAIKFDGIRKFFSRPQPTGRENTLSFAMVRMDQTKIVPLGESCELNSGPLTMCSVAVLKKYDSENNRLGTAMIHRGIGCEEAFADDLLSEFKSNFGEKNARSKFMF